jgi:hypothetical protein
MINILKKKLPEPELKEILNNFLQQAMMMNGTKAGTLQMINSHDHSLEIVSSFGLSNEFIEHFKKVTIMMVQYVQEHSRPAKQFSSGTSHRINNLPGIYL